MKIRLKSGFWKKDPQEWKRKYDKLNFSNLMIYVAIIAGAIFESKIIVYGASITMLLVCTLIMASYIKSKKNNSEEQDGQETNTNTREEKQSKNN